MPFGERATAVLRHLPLWRSSAVDTCPSPTVSAAKAILLPSRDWIFQGLVVNVTFLSNESPLVQELIRLLGGKSLTSHQYILENVIPNLPTIVTDSQIPSIQQFLDFVLRNLSEWPQSIQSQLFRAALIPDRNLRLKVPSTLFDAQEPVFAAAFRGEKSLFFPHQSLTMLHLRNLGVNSTLTKQTFLTCVQRLDRDHKRGDPTVWERSVEIWQAFVNRGGQFITRTKSESQELARYYFVPVHQYISEGAPSYRDIIVRDVLEKRAQVVTMNDIVASRYLSIAWTQKRIPGTPPPTWTDGFFKFSPTVSIVVRHLISMATVVAHKCEITDASFYTDFFTDLKATYDYLANPRHIGEASALIRNHYQDKPIWLNEDATFEMIPRSAVRPLGGGLPISSLKWLRAKAILLDVPFDVNKSNHYSVKASMERYRDLLRACGSLGIQSPDVNLEEEDAQNHGNKIVYNLKRMRESSDDFCDFTIIVDGKRFRVHLMLLVAVSSWFRTITGNEWKESKSGILDLDEEQSRYTQSEGSTDAEGRQGSSSSERRDRLYGTAESVASVIEWVYEASVNLDDDNLTEVDKVKARLDHYFDILQLADVWGIPLLRSHVENRVLNQKKVFIRPENVRGVYERANDCEAGRIAEYCQTYMEDNERVVKVVEADEQE